MLEPTITLATILFLFGVFVLSLTIHMLMTSRVALFVRYSASNTTTEAEERWIYWSVVLATTLSSLLFFAAGLATVHLV